MMMDRQCSGIESLPFFTTEDDTPIHLHHEVVKCKGVFSVLCDIRIDKNKDLTFKDVVGEVRKVLKSNMNINPPKPFDLVISRAALKAKSFAPDTLAQNEIIFKKWFAELVAYEGKHGNCNVSTVTGEDNKLGKWLSNTRQTYKKKEAGDIDPDGRILTEDQIVQLEALGVQWSLQATFEERFEELKAFNDVHGRCPIDADEGHEQLYKWLNNTREAYKKGKSSKRKLSDEQRKQFAKIGLVSSFEEKLEELRAFKGKHNGCCPKKSDGAVHKKLINWVRNMRRISKEKQDGMSSTTSLTDEQITQFERIGLTKKAGRQITKQSS
jgi:Spy/CpxP family protein refolding chaperone